jgi:Nucleotidyl transferase AbiEii toxin, Type IV TA system
MDWSASVLTTFERTFPRRLFSSIPGLYLSGGRRSRSTWGTVDRRIWICSLLTIPRSRRPARHFRWWQPGSVRESMDPPAEIVVNKLCAILGRSEPRDLVDLFFLDRAGYPPLAALDRARRKDTGLTPGLLAWAIRQVPLDRLPDGLLAPVSLEQLSAFRMCLVEALERLSFPDR